MNLFLLMNLNFLGHLYLPPGRVCRYEAAPGEYLSVVVRPKLSERDFEIVGHVEHFVVVYERLLDFYPCHCVTAYKLIELCSAARFVEIFELYNHQYMRIYTIPEKRL